MTEDSPTRTGARWRRAVSVVIGVAAVITVAAAACSPGTTAATDRGSAPQTTALTATSAPGPGSTATSTLPSEPTTSSPATMPPTNTAPTTRPPTTIPVPVSVAPATTTATAPDPAPRTTGCPEINGYITVTPGRRALVRAPAAAARRPAVVVLHGYTGSPERIEATSGWTPFAQRQGAIAVYPEGTAVSAGGYAWATGTARFSAVGVDDVSYLQALVFTLLLKACVDPGHVLLTGESNGGAMTVLAACDQRTSAAFTLFAPVIPAVDAHVLEHCGAGPAVKLVALAGRLDQTVPYDGVYPPGQIPLLGQEQWFLAFAAQRNGCSATDPDRTRIPDGEEIRPTGCIHAPLLVAIDDARHTWPGGPVVNGNLPAGTFGATAYLWHTFAGA